MTPPRIDRDRGDAAHAPPHAAGVEPCIGFVPQAQEGPADAVFGLDEDVEVPGGAAFGQGAEERADLVFLVRSGQRPLEADHPALGEHRDALCTLRHATFDDVARARPFRREDLVTVEHAHFHAGAPAGRRRRRSRHRLRDDVVLQQTDPPPGQPLQATIGEIDQSVRDTEGAEHFAKLGKHSHAAASGRSRTASFSESFEHTGSRRFAVVRSKTAHRKTGRPGW